MNSMGIVKNSLPIFCEFGTICLQAEDEDRYLVAKKFHSLMPSIFGTFVESLVVCTKCRILLLACKNAQP